MKNSVWICIVVLFLLNPLLLSAQRVLYSPLISNSSVTRFEVIGKAGNFYWIQKSKKNNTPKKGTDTRILDKELSFEVYDARMNEVKLIPYTFPDTLLKEYLLTGDDYFDQLTVTSTPNQTRILLNRYTPQGNSIYDQYPLADLPGTIRGNDVLLIRSQDKSKLLLLAFETLRDSLPRLHATLYDRNWKVIFHTVYKDRNLAQPFSQYDFINYPLEHFDNSPVKLANSGAWLTVAPSRTNSNYLLWHFNPADSSFTHKEIRFSQNARVQNLVLSLDNDKEEAFAGILLNTRFPAVKKARVSHYLLSQSKFDFDTTYGFNTAATNKTGDENLFEQYFMMVPGKGFMLLKEYGKPYSATYSNEDIRKDEQEDETSAVTSTVAATVNKNDYTRFSNLTSARKEYGRGDLSLYYFPATPKDTCWSGIINQEQTTELNSSYLSYMFIAIDGKLIFLYNSLFNNNDKYSSTTILDQKGNSLNEGLVFWRTNNILDFQKARQISATELAVPYERNMRNGFAIISL